MRHSISLPSRGLDAPPASDAAPAPLDTPLKGRDLTGVLDSVLAGIVVFDRGGQVELANATACRILEQSAQSILDRPVEECLFIFAQRLGRQFEQP